MEQILAINPGSTSTKIALYEGVKEIFTQNIHHSHEDLQSFEKITDQFEFRRKIILEELEKRQVDMGSIKLVVGRGGLIKPVASGVYEVNDALLRDLHMGVSGEHASNLGGLIAYDIAQTIPDTKAFIADPVVVDELDDIARISGHASIERISIFHALNHKAVARSYAHEIHKKYEDLNLIVIHMGGGISVGAHCQGKVIDVNNALDGDGPFSPERTGGLPVGTVVKMCFSGSMTYEEVKRELVGRGGFVSYLGTNNGLEVEQLMMKGDAKAKLIFDAMGYQVSKEIGALSTVLKGKVDAIIMTGGLAHSRYLVDYIKDRVGFLAPVHVHPGEDEMYALALNGYLVLSGSIPVSMYV